MRSRRIRLRPTALTAALVAALASVSAPASAQAPDATDDAPGKPRVVVLSDIGNEPDDQMSLTRLTLYANQLSIEGLVATTSTWQRTEVRPDIMTTVLDHYGQVQPNLLRHDRAYPSAAQLRDVVRSGQDAYGMAAVGAGESTAGSRQIIAAADRDDARPLWVTVWGGANTLAQALYDVRATRTPEQLAAFVAKLRVYSISDQDDAGPWIRREFPGLSYVVTPSSPDADEYQSATWTGIAGDEFYRNGDGADFTTVSNEWLDKHIRNQGPFGAAYPRYAFIMEGDTPSFLGLIDNGLASWRSPSWGGWGGRYVYRQPYGESHAIWTQGGGAFASNWSRDTVIGVDGERHTSDQATIWRWREAFQHDFEARMGWTVKSPGQANHAPDVRVNGSTGTAPLRVDAQVGKPLALDAGGTRDRDGDRLRYRWIPYPEAGAGTGQSRGTVSLSRQKGPRTTVTPTSTCPAAWRAVPCRALVGTAHVILAVTDRGSPTLTSYRRVILNITAAP